MTKEQVLDEVKKINAAYKGACTKAHNKLVHTKACINRSFDSEEKKEARRERAASTAFRTVDVAFKRRNGKLAELRARAGEWAYLVRF